MGESAALGKLGGSPALSETAEAPSAKVAQQTGLSP